jgi:3-oxoacyl-[acyl-carrier protein] reductase
VAAARTALVTGATRGIGLAVAQRLAADGLDLALSARNADALDAVADQLRRTHHVEVRTIPADLTDPSTPGRLIEAHGAVFDQLGVLVLNAGAGAVGPLTTTTREMIERLVALNATSSLELFTAALPLMRKAVQADHESGAKVIALSSITGVYPPRKMGAYAASKAALRSLVESINLEHSHEGITATAVCPGYVATEMTSWLSDRIPVETMLSTDDVASVVSMLAGKSRRVVINQVVMSRAGTDGRTP